MNCEWMYENQLLVESKNCKVGDKVHYYHQSEDGFTDNFDFIVTFIGKSNNDTIVRIYGGTKGCIVYDDEFEKYCKVIN